MLYKFDDIIYNQINFYYDNYDKVFDFLRFNQGYRNFNQNTCIFKHSREILNNERDKTNVENIIKKLRDYRNVYLTTSTITPSEYQFHPLVNIHIHWNHLPIENNLVGDGDSTVFAWDTDIYNHLNQINFNKNIKSILSIRRKTHFRDILFSKITPDINSIFRYHEYTNVLNKKFEYYKQNESSPPTWQELCTEYKQSIFSFIVETDNGDTPNINSQITEKTLNAFMNGTVPIILGHKNFVNELKNIGLYVWNDEFGFDDADSSDSYEYRLQRFIYCYDNIKKMTWDESIGYWNDNVHVIQKNYDIVSNLLTKNWKPIPTNLI